MESKIVSGVYVVNDPVANAGNFSLAEWLLTARPGAFGRPAGAANPTGWALAAALLVLGACSQPCVRRRGSFEVTVTSWLHRFRLNVDKAASRRNCHGKFITIVISS